MKRKKIGTDGDNQQKKAKTKSDNVSLLEGVRTDSLVIADNKLSTEEEIELKTSDSAQLLENIKAESSDDIKSVDIRTDTSIESSQSIEYFLDEAYENIDVPLAEREIIRDFYDEVIARFSAIEQKIGFVVVCHLVSTLPFFLEALRKVGDIAIYVPKGTVKDDDKIKGWLDTIDIKCFDEKEQSAFLQKVSVQKNSNLKSAREVIFDNEKQFIKHYCKIYDKVVVIDIGAYFSGLVKHSDKIPKVIGYVEDTENGLKRYSTALKDMDDNKKRHVPPIISVARSEIKDSEDYNVGKAITDATDHILRVADYTHLAENKTILVIGYGKVGAAAAKVASEKTRGPVLICEKKPVRKLKASAHSFKVVDLAEGLRQADVIISCTGQKALTEEYLEVLKDGVYIASCTSADDEFHESFLKAISYKAEGNKLVEKYCHDNKAINLVNNGKSVNFVEKAVHGYFIHGVLASLLVAGIRIIQASQGNDDAVKKGEIVDFSTLREETSNEKYQNVISDILMRNKLRGAPKLTNHQIAKKRYIPREDDIKRLKSKLQEGKVAWITGEEKAGKSQVVERFCHLNLCRYDIIWKFYCSSSLRKQFEDFKEEFEKKVNSKDIVELYDGASRNTQLDIISTPIPNKTQQNARLSKEVQEISVSEKSDGRPSSERKKRQESDVMGQVTKAKDIIGKLERTKLSYLLVFEDVVNTGDFKAFSPFLEQQSKQKRHVILTSSTDVFSRLSRSYPIMTLNIQLNAFPNSALFAFLSEDEEIEKSWAENVLKKVINNFEDITKGIEEQTLSAKNIVTLINLSASAYKNTEDLPGKTILASNCMAFESFTNGLDYFVTKLNEKDRLLLSVFYVPFELGAMSSLIKEDMLRKFVQKNTEFFNNDGIDSLEKNGFIKKDGDFLKPVHEAKLDLVLNHQNNFAQMTKDFAVHSLVKAMCSYQEENIYYLRILKIVDDFIKNPTDFTKQWSIISGPLYYKALKKIAHYYQVEEDPDDRVPKLLEDALVAANRIYSGNSPKFAKTASELADHYFSFGNHKKAEEHYKKAKEAYAKCSYAHKVGAMDEKIKKCENVKVCY